MSDFSVVTAKQGDAYQQLNDRLQAARLPEFLNHDADLPVFVARR